MEVAEKTSTAGRSPALLEGGLPFFQPKLAIGPVDDPYEREADQVADSVMRMPASGIFSPAITGVQRSTMEEEEPVQRKCAACEAEDNVVPVQRKCEHCGEEEVIQRDAIDCNMFSAEADKAEETEADETVQRKCAHCEQEEQIQRHGDGSAVATDAFESQLSSSKGGGEPLSGDTRSFMEERFDRDFSNVRVHAGSNAATMSNSIQAHAFTHGSDIYFNSGQYSPNTDSGKQLLAHELTHVVQQSGGGLQRKPVVQQNDRLHRDSAALQSDHSHQNSGGPIVQRAFYFGSKYGGTSTHSVVLPAFNKANPSDLFTEVSIPGADKSGVGEGKRGVADFYRTHGKAATIGINYNEDGPQYLRKDKDLTAPNGYNHNKNATPRGGKAKPRVRGLGENPPSKVEIGDLKPAYSSESWFAGDQVRNYITGIHNTKSSVNAFLAADNAQSDSSEKQWHIEAVPMNTLDIPDDLRYTVGSGIKGFKNMPLSMFRAGDKRPYIEDVGMKGTMYVYKEKEATWTYDWFPDKPTVTGNKDVNAITDRLQNNVIPGLTKTGGVTIQPKRKLVIQRKDEKFSNTNWKKQHYTPWKEDASKVLKDKGKVKETEILTGINDVEKRSGHKIPGVTDEMREHGKGVSKVKHWKRFGGFYGWLREKFDFIYVKIQKVAEKVKKKMADMTKGSGGAATNWLKAFMKVVFKIFKMVGSWVVTQVVDKLMGSLKQGMINNMQKLFLSLLPDEAKVYLAKFCELKKEYSTIIDKNEEELIKSIFGDKLDLLEDIQKMEEKVSVIADIMSIIEWGVALLACASPPAIGCLWNVAIKALMWAFAKLLSTCWFTKEVYAPIMSKIDLLRTFPAEVAAKVVDSANGVLPVPAGLDKWFAPITIDTSEFKVNCNEGSDGSGKLTDERRTVMDIAQQKDGSEKLKAGLELMNKRGAGPWALLTKERADMLKDMLQTASPADMSAAAKDKSKPLPAGTETLVGDMSKYTAKENKLIAANQAEKRAKAAAAEQDKELEALMNHPKAQEALAKPWPAREYLKIALGAVPWNTIHPGSGRFINVGGAGLLVMKGEKGSRQGAFIKYYEAEYQGAKHKLLLQLGEFLTLDDVPDNDNATFSLSGGFGGLYFHYFKRHKAGEFFAPVQEAFAGSFFEF